MFVVSPADIESIVTAAATILGGLGAAAGWAYSAYKKTLHPIQGFAERVFEMRKGSLHQVGAVSPVRA